MLQLATLRFDRSSLPSLMNRLALRTDAIAAFAVLLGVMMLIAPLPAAVLDFMVAVSLAGAVLILIGATYARSMLDYSTLPTLLLITTMYRLSLEVAITRVVLLEAHAGDIVQTFGEIVAGGNLAVGIVIFAILTVVNFIVITKGSERVAEVGARFSLDAMPGRQMSIDAELRAGHISVQEATARRQQLSRESQMHGSMDGAMKFVKGDAIAGIVILLVNLIGGLVVGTQLHGMSLGEASRVYSVLSIGEGLVSQVPSLMISVAAGILITLGEQENTESAKATGSVIAREVFGAPGVVLAAGVIVSIIALVPGMPAAPFLPLGALFVGGALLRMRRARRERKESEAADKGRIRDEMYFLAAEPYRMRFVHSQEAGALASRIEASIRTMRNGIVEKGYILPPFDVETDVKAAHAGVQVEFSVNEVPFLSVRLAEGEYGANETVERLAASGVIAKPRPMVRGSSPVSVLDETGRRAAAEAGIETLPMPEMLCRAIEEIIWATSSSFISVHESQRMLNWAARNSPEMHEEARKNVPARTLAQVVQRLACERVAVRNAFTILDTLCRWAPKEREVELLVEQVRLALRYEICQQVAPNSRLNAVLLSPRTEALLRSARRTSSTGTYVALDATDSIAFIDAMRAQCVAHQTFSTALAVVTAEDLRPHVRRLLSDELPSVPVLSFAELTNHVTVTPVGEIALETA